MRRFPLRGLAGLGETGKGILDKLLVAQIGNEFAFRADIARRGGESQDFLLELVNSLARQRGRPEPKNASAAQRDASLSLRACSSRAISACKRAMRSAISFTERSSRLCPIS